jgi:short-subunit dehydrogenase
MGARRIGEGQTALVTGASGGIGLELARCFAKDGYNLVVVARSADTLVNVAADLAGECQVDAVAIACDLGRPDAGATLAAELDARGIAIDVLVNNAAYGMAGAFTVTDRQAQLGMVDLNMRALVELTHIYWSRLLAKNKGGVLNVASTGAFQPVPLMAVYCATNPDYSRGGVKLAADAA